MLHFCEWRGLCDVSLWLQSTIIIASLYSGQITSGSERLAIKMVMPENGEIKLDVSKMDQCGAFGEHLISNWSVQKRQTKNSAKTNLQMMWIILRRTLFDLILLIKELHTSNGQKTLQFSTIFLSI